LAQEAYLSLATVRKAGGEVATPGWFAADDDDIYMFSAADAGKFKRLRNSARSRVAACSVTGKVHGPWLDADTEILESAEDIDKALAALGRKYGWQMRATNLLSRLSGKYHKRAYLRARLAAQ